MTSPEPRSRPLRVSIFSKIPIFPAHGGNRARLQTLCTALKESGCALRFVIFPSQQLRDFDEAAHHAFFGPGQLHVLRRSPVAFALFALTVTRLRVLKRTKAGDQRSRDPDYLYAQTFNRQIRILSRTYPADIAIVEYVHFSRALEEIPPTTFKVLDTHDSFHNEFTAAAETKGLLRADKILAIQDDEATLFRSYLGDKVHRVAVQSHILTIGDIVDTTATAGATFIGSSFEANIISIRYVIGEVLPLILAQRPAFRLHVAGTICQDVEDAPHIVKLGRVPTVADAFHAAPILLNSIRAGTGVKIKLLEAMALGIPVVSTAMGLGGLSPTFRQGSIEVADTDAAGFAEAAIKLFDSAAHRAALGSQARQSALHWNTLQRERLTNLLDEARAHRARHDKSSLSPTD